MAFDFLSTSSTGWSAAFFIYGAYCRAAARAPVFGEKAVNARLRAGLALLIAI